ncbi:hypothetical protein [Acidovorax carolinensis]|uniref:hypothetical protein n=1 Tax=Acidovorax carolinensis TaxID=553814 RepID=UPI001F26DFCA|nr:hypothetical protein [Acidovorax carolinensis]
MDYFEAIAGAGVIQLTLGCAHGGAQCQAANAAHSVDTHLHDTVPLVISIFIEILQS